MCKSPSRLNSDVTRGLCQEFSPKRDPRSNVCPPAPDMTELLCGNRRHRRCPGASGKKQLQVVGASSAVKLARRSGRVGH
jgi:hypothetical protein